MIKIRRNQNLLIIILTAIVALGSSVPSLLHRFYGLEVAPYFMALWAGIAIFAAAFIILWACDAVQSDISSTLAVAIVAVVAILPEYAVDIYFTWMAGKYPESEYSHYAIANMTGANRLLIGIGWAVIAYIVWFKTRKSTIEIEEERSLELVFLLAATLVAFLVCINKSLTLLHAFLFIGLFVLFIVIAGKRPIVEPDIEGPGKYLASLKKGVRRFSTTILFIYSALVILANAEAFSEGLVHTGKMFKINEFLLVQWVAPLASEAPEFIIAILIAVRGHSGLAMSLLISSKLNQWTLLVGMIPVVFAISSGSVVSPIPMGHFQMNEILLTAAQSLLAIAILINLKFSILEASLLFVLFFAQFALPAILTLLGVFPTYEASNEVGHSILSFGFYLPASIAAILINRFGFARIISALRNIFAGNVKT